MSRLDLLIRNAEVYRCEGEGLGHLANSALGVSDGQITYLGPSSEAPIGARREVDAGGRALLPGLVDPHTHLVFGGSRVDEFSRRMSNEDYRAIAAAGGGIASTVRQTRAASDEVLFESAKHRALAMRRRGITCLEVKSGYGLTLDDELRCLRVARELDRQGIIRTSPTFLGAHSVPNEYRHDRAAYLKLVIEEMIPRVASEGLADSCDVYCDDGAFSLEESERVWDAALKHGLAVRGHVGQFCDLGGAGALAHRRALSADHLEDISDAEIIRLAEAGVTAVLLPGAWRTLRQEPPRAERFRSAGVRLAVGTDLNPGTSPCPDLPLCAALAVRDAGATPEEAILGITSNAALAVGRQDLGRLSLGSPADFAIFPFQDARTLVYSLGSESAWQVYLGGTLVDSKEDAVSLW